MPIDKKDFDHSCLLSVKVSLEPITSSSWYDMRREQTNFPSLSEVNSQECSFCLNPLKDVSYIKCLECTNAEVLICITCFRHGVQSGEHVRGHNYEICDPVGSAVFGDTDNEEWGCHEDLTLLSSFYKSHLDQWTEISKDFVQKRTLDEALDRIDKYFLRGDIGSYILKNFRRGNVKVWDEDPETPTDSDQLEFKFKNQNGLNGSYSPCEEFNSIEPSTPVAAELTPETSSSLVSNVMKLRLNRSNTSGSCQPISANKPRVSFEEEDTNGDLECSALAKRRLSSRSNKSSSTFTAIVDTPTTSAASTPLAQSDFPIKLTRKEQLLEAAKTEAAEALRYSRARKSSLELSEALNNNNQIDDETGKKKLKSGQKQVNNIFSDEKLADLCASVQGNPYFFSHFPALMNPEMVGRFDEEDLQLLAYMPFRDEFENEYRNEAELLISRICFTRESPDGESEVEQLQNEVRFARIDRYNRIMKMRVARRGATIAQQLLNEFLNVVKSNLCEKGKYFLLEDRYFNSKNKEDYFRPLFFQLRQVADKETINTLARNIGAMETLKDQIDELRDLQKQGVTKMKGRLKVDATPVMWSKKRRIKKADNVSQRKAGLRWKRIKRWSKKHNYQITAADIAGADEAEL